MALKSVVLLVASLLLLGAPLSAQVPLQPQTQGGIAFVSGGIGDEERGAINQLKGGYNLHLTFAAQGSGQFLADVKVKLLDEKGKTLLDAISDGPFFLARVSPGRYRVVAEAGGRSTEKTVEVPAKGAASLYFHWASVR